MMKNKIIKTSIILICFYSCVKEDNSCVCKAEYTTQSQFGNGNSFFVPKTLIDCESQRPLELPQEDAIFIRCVD